MLAALPLSSSMLCQRLALLSGATRREQPVKPSALPDDSPNWDKVVPIVAQPEVEDISPSSVR